MISRCDAEPVLRPDAIAADIRKAVSDLLPSMEFKRLEVSEVSDGYTQVVASLVGDSKDDCLLAAKLVLNHVAKGKDAIIREFPEADTQKDFASHRMIHRGYVRFYFRDQPGEWKAAELTSGLPWIFGGKA